MQIPRLKTPTKKPKTLYARISAPGAGGKRIRVDDISIAYLEKSIQKRQKMMAVKIDDLILDWKRAKSRLQQKRLNVDEDTGHWLRFTDHWVEYPLYPLPRRFAWYPGGFAGEYHTPALRRRAPEWKGQSGFTAWRAVGMILPPSCVYDYNQQQLEPRMPELRAEPISMLMSEADRTAVHDYPEIDGQPAWNKLVAKIVKHREFIEVYVPSYKNTSCRLVHALCQPDYETDEETPVYKGRTKIYGGVNFYEPNGQTVPLNPKRGTSIYDASNRLYV